VASRGEHTPAQDSIAHRLEHNPVLGFAPWIIFWVIGGPSTC
jgi:hypothetical protein